MKRIPEVLDCWFESGSMPYGQDHWMKGRETDEQGSVQELESAQKTI